MRKIMLILLILIASSLAGCIEPEDANGTATSAPTPNHAPEISVEHSNFEHPVVNFSSMYNASLPTNLSMINDTVLILYHATIDIDGDNLTSGYDIDLDGQIDIHVVNSSGYTNISVPTSLWTQHPVINTSYRITIAFIAIDEHGAGNSEFIHTGIDVATLGWWNNVLAPTIGLYQFTGKDVTSESGELSSQTDDELVRMTMDRGDDIQWSRLSIRIEVNGEAPRTCANPGQDSANNDCVIVDNGADTTDQDFAAGDSFTIQEDGQQICDGTGQCEVVVTIVESVLGETIDTTTVMAS